MKIQNNSLLLGLAALLLAATASLRAAEHVVLMAWDGLRPDMVNAENTPALQGLARGGTFFHRHHAVYPSSTEVNGTALATGMYPANSGVIGNREFRPRIKPDEAIATESLDAIRKGDELTGGKYLAAPTLYEILQARGFRTVVAGTKRVAVLPDRSATRTSPAAAESTALFEGKTLPPDLISRLEADYGKFPVKLTFPDTGQNTWTTDSLLGTLWKDGVPKLSLLWLSDPDYSQHDSQPGSKEALASLKVNDGLLSRVLAALDEKGIRDRTDILIVSDHGFSTIEESLDVAALLAEAGFRTFRKYFHEPRPGDILVVSNGGSVFFYVANHDRETVRGLVRFLMGSAWCGVIFADGDGPGTFPLQAAHINSPDAPDVVVSMAWSPAANASGVRGLICSDSAGVKRPGQGMHASLSPYDMHNTLIAPPGPTSVRASWTNCRAATWMSRPPSCGPWASSPATKWTGASCARRSFLPTSPPRNPKKKLLPPHRMRGSAISRSAPSKTPNTSTKAE
jgi:hypothetical protein